jgi:hypothetical protein
MISGSSKDDLEITDPHDAGEVTENNQTAVAAPEDVVVGVWLVIQRQLRGIGRFGYRVSKEIFFFSDGTARSCLTPPAEEYFIAPRECRGWAPGRRKSHSYSQLGRKQRDLVAMHNDI